MYVQLLLLCGEGGSFVCSVLPLLCFLVYVVASVKFLNIIFCLVGGKVLEKTSLSG